MKPIILYRDDWIDWQIYSSCFPTFFITILCLHSCCSYMDIILFNFNSIKKKKKVNQINSKQIRSMWINESL